VKLEDIDDDNEEEDEEESRSEERLENEAKLIQVSGGL
jgi:hypothetical protein